MASPKTTEVLLKDGRVGRGVKVTSKNPQSLAEWGGVLAKALDSVATGPRVRVHTKKGIRVAYPGDTIVKLNKTDLLVIKADDFAKYITL